MEAGEGSLFIAFDPGGLLFLPTMSSRYIGRCSFERESVLSVDELGMRIVASVYIGRCSFERESVLSVDELRMRIVASVATLA